MSARDVVADVLMNDGCGDSDQCDATAARVLSALHAAGLVVEQGWQTIDSAPRDGTRVLLFCPGATDWARVVFGRWYTEQYAKKPRPYWSNDQERLWGVLATRDNQPTHWRPLPAPPETTP